MTPDNLLGGKVTVFSLPTYHPPFAEHVDGPKRLFLEKGELAQIFNSHDPIRLIAYIEFHEGTTRGGHYHPNREERIYLIRGKLSMRVIDVETEEERMRTIQAGDLVYISPNVAHEFTTIEPGHAIEFSSQLFDPAGTVRLR